MKVSIVMRRGYTEEYWVKKKLVKEYGEWGVVKAAIGQRTADFLVIKNGKIVKVVEVKKTKKKRWRPKKREIYQLLLIKQFCKVHNVPCEYWIREGRKRRVVPIEDVLRQVLKSDENEV